MNPGRRSMSAQSSRKISSARNPANAPSARQGVTFGDALLSNAVNSAGVKTATGERFSLRFSTLQSKSTSSDNQPCF
jgi:hypothetical protein